MSLFTWDPVYAAGTYQMLWEVDPSGTIATKTQNSTIITMLRSHEAVSGSFEVGIRSLTYAGQGRQQTFHTVGLAEPDYDYVTCGLRSARNGGCLGFCMHTGQLATAAGDQAFSQQFAIDDVVSFAVDSEAKTVHVTHVAAADGKVFEETVNWPTMADSLHLAVSMDQEGSSVQIEDPGCLTKAARS